MVQVCFQFTFKLLDICSCVNKTGCVWLNSYVFVNCQWKRRKRKCRMLNFSVRSKSIQSLQTFLHAYAHSQKHTTDTCIYFIDTHANNWTSDSSELSERQHLAAAPFTVLLLGWLKGQKVGKQPAFVYVCVLCVGYIERSVACRSIAPSHHVHLFGFGSKVHPPMQRHWSHSLCEIWLRGAATTFL